MESFKEDSFAVFLITTYHEGQPPDTAEEFWKKFEETKDSKCLENLKFLLFALGDLNYRYFCRFGKQVNEKLKALGATNVHPEIGTGSNDQQNIELYFNNWKNTIWNDLYSNAPTNPNFKGELGGNKLNLVPKPSVFTPKYIVEVIDEQPSPTGLKPQLSMDVNTSVDQG